MDVVPRAGWETQALRTDLGLPKSRRTSEETLWAHCVDSWTLAASAVGGPSPDVTTVLRLSPVRLHLRQPHRIEPAHGGVRRLYGGTRSLGLKIRAACTRLEAAIYGLTDRRIAQALADAPGRHADTWVVMEAPQARRPGSQAPFLERALGSYLALRTGRAGLSIMHHIFLVADDRLVATGPSTEPSARTGLRGGIPPDLDSPVALPRAERGGGGACRRRGSPSRTPRRRKHEPLNKALSLFRDRTRASGRETDLAAEVPSPTAPDPFDIAAHRETGREIAELAEHALSPLEAQVLALRLEGVPYRDIAAEIGRPWRAVDNAVQRLRETLGHVLVWVTTITRRPPYFGDQDF